MSMRRRRLVTIEDLVEEIVEKSGRTREAEIVRENDQSYIVSGGMDVDGLAELFGKKLEEGRSATICCWSASWRDTFHVAAKPWMMGACDSEVLEATDRKVERVRITGPAPAVEID